MKRLLLILSLTLVTQVSLAEAVCNSLSSSDSIVLCKQNKRILRKLNRLQGGDGSSGSVSATFSCGGNAELIATGVSLTTGESSTYKVTTGNWNTCQKTASQLTKKFRGQTISGGIIFAVCASNANLKKVVISTDAGIKEFESVRTGNWTTCQNDAEEINQI